MDEFTFIARRLAPLATEKGALGLKDDAAVLSVPRGQELVITKDAMTEGVHFIGDETPGLIARKLLRANLSDLAAMGAKPWGYFLALMLPESADGKWLSAFAAGLRKDQKEFAVTLMGGDTTRTLGTLALSITALGLVPTDKALKRSGAKAGDDIYVSGTIGDAALGLKLTTDPYLLNRYRLPLPRLALGSALRGVATAAIDISDGLMQDLGHICETSRLGAEIYWQDVPLSRQARKALGRMDRPQETVLAGGDDYELLFAAPHAARRKIQAIAHSTNTPVALIGRMLKGKKAKALDAEDRVIALPQKGWRHF